MSESTMRCAAAHRQDPTPCEGPGDAVLIRDAAMGRRRSDDDERGVLGCVHHGARMLASLEGGLVYPGPSNDSSGPRGGAAVEAFNRAQDLKPFAWMHEGGDLA